MEKRFSKQELYMLRNNIPIEFVIVELLKLPATGQSNVCRFSCPQCRKLTLAINRRTNLAYCSRCKKSFNTIDLVMCARRLSFVETVRFLNESSTALGVRPKSVQQILRQLITLDYQQRLSDKSC